MWCGVTAQGSRISHVFILSTDYELIFQEAGVFIYGPICAPRGVRMTLYKLFILLKN